MRAENPRNTIISRCLRGPRNGKISWRADGNGVFSIPHAGGVFMGHDEGNQVFLPFLKNRQDMLSGNLKVAGGRVKVPTYGITQANGRVFARLKNRSNPTGQPVRIAATNGPALLRLTKSPYVIVDGFTFECSGQNPAIVSDSASHHATIRNNAFELSRIGLTAADDAIIEWNEYHYPNFMEWAKEVRTANGNPQSPLHVFDYVKLYNSKNGNSVYEGGMTESASGKRPEQRLKIRFNYYHDNFDGERIGSFENSDLAHNVFQFSLDNAYEAESFRGGKYQGKNLRIHENLFMDGMGAHMSHQDNAGAMVGPQYVYRNVVYDSDPLFGRGATIIKNRHLSKKGCHVYVYHNVLQSYNGYDHNSVAVKFGATDQLYRNAAVDDPQFIHLRNNAIIFRGGSSKHGRRPAGDSNFNIVMDTTNNPSHYGPNGKRTANLAQLGFANYGVDFTPTGASILIGAAGPLPAAWKAPDVQGMPKADIGVFQVAKPQPPKWPRPYSRKYAHVTYRLPLRWK